MSHDWLIVGAGFSGCVMARQLADAGKRVLIIDKRDHIGGNAYDYVNEHGVRIHKYGPHIFHTNCDKVFEFLSRFTEWRPYEHRVLSSVDGKLVPFPINITTMEMLYGREFDARSMHRFLFDRVTQDWPERVDPETAEDQVISQIGSELYELFFAGYTRKMWGVDGSKLDRSVTARIPIRYDRDDRYFTDKHQAMPKDGYTAMFERMLDHPNIEIDLNHQRYGCDLALTGLGGKLPPIQWRSLGSQRTIWTGPIDEYFGHCFGPLPYRSLRFEQDAYNASMKNSAATVNYPEVRYTHTRITNMGLLTQTGGDLGTDEGRMMWEYPEAEGDPYYPIPAPENRALYQRYREFADKQESVLFLGRLGTYQYLNMDQVVGQALACARRILA